MYQLKDRKPADGNRGENAALIERDALILPAFAQKEWVDLARAMTILGVWGAHTIYRLRCPRTDRPYLETIDYGEGRRQRVKYQSIVRYCDWLRELYAIPDRRPPLGSGCVFRHRDEDLLPFPLTDSIDARAACLCTAYESTRSIYRFIEEGAFHAYQIFPGDSPWRISRTDFARWLKRVSPGVRSSAALVRRPQRGDELRGCFV